MRRALARGSVHTEHRFGSGSGAVTTDGVPAARIGDVLGLVDEVTLPLRRDEDLLRTHVPALSVRLRPRRLHLAAHAWIRSRPAPLAASSAVVGPK